MSNLTMLTGVWQHEKTLPDGTKELYFTGTLGSASILIFANLDKKKEGANPKLPDYKVFVRTPDFSKISKNKNTNNVSEQETSVPFDSDDIPF